MAYSQNTVFCTLWCKRGHFQTPEYADKFEKVEKLKDLSITFNTYIDSLRVIFLDGVEDPKDYEAMDKTSSGDEYFFAGDGLSKNGS